MSNHFRWCTDGRSGRHCRAGLLPGLALGFAALVLVLVPGAGTARAAIPNVRITNESAQSDRPRVALDPSGNMVVVWEDARHGNYEILWQKLDALGNAISQPIRVTNTAGASLRADVAVDAAGTSHIVWQEGDNPNGVGTVYLCRLDANGTKILNDTMVMDFGGRPRVALAPGGACDVVWYRSKVVDFYVYYRRYTSTGTVACEKTYDAGSLTQVEKDPVVTTSAAGDATLFYRDLTTSFTYALLHGTASGACAKTNGIIFNNGSAIRPTIATGGPYTFRMLQNGGDIYNLTGTNTVYKISQGSGQASYPSVGADSHDGYVVWRDARDGNPEIYFARFWTSTNRTGDVRLTTDGAASEYPDIAVDPSGSGDWVAVWRDSRDGNGEIYMTSRLLIDAPVPAPPASATTALVGCPPTIQVSWIDASSNETAFEISREVDGSGTWAAVQTTAANAQSWVDASIDYSHAYRYRVRSCNGLYCSSDVTTVWQSVDEDMRVLAGTVRATIVDRPHSAPSLQPLPRVRVTRLRDGQPVGDPVYANSLGYFDFGAVVVRCDDQLRVDLAHAHMAVEDRQAGGSAVYCLNTPVVGHVFSTPSVGAADVTWPVLEGDISGEAVNAHFWAERAFADYWQPLRGLSDDARDPLHLVTRFPAADARFLGCSNGYYVNILGTGYATCRSAVVHEFAHAVLRRDPGLAERKQNGLQPHPAAGPIDEALADYFTASWSGSPEIFPMAFLGGLPIRLRTLVTNRRMPACGGTYRSSGDRYGESLALSGALWDLRTRLTQDRGIPVAGVDRAVLEGFATVMALPADSRDFLAMRNAIAQAMPAAAPPTDIAWAFDRHNIKVDADGTCLPLFDFLQVHQQVVPQGRQVDMAWTTVPGALHYRVFRNTWGATAIGYGELIADSLETTSYRHVEPDTSLTLAFMVVALDSTGESMAATPESPQVTDVGGPRPVAETTPPLVSPNPARGAVLVRCEDFAGQVVVIECFDIGGRRVLRKVLSPAQAPGWNWDGRGSDGAVVQPGIYRLRVTGPHSVRHASIVRLK